MMKYKYNENGRERDKVGCTPLLISRPNVQLCANKGITAWSDDVGNNLYALPPIPLTEGTRINPNREGVESRCENIPKGC